MKESMKNAVFFGLSLSFGSAAQAESNYELAQRVAAIVGIGESGSCSSCHATSSLATMSRWSYGLKMVNDCLANTASNAQEKLSCILGQDASQGFDPGPAQLGFYSAALHLEPLQKLLVEAYGSERALTIGAELREHSLMPLRSNNLLTAEQFAAIDSWVTRGMPYLRDLLRPPTSISCEDSISPKMRKHIISTARDNWQTRNQARGMPLFACPPAPGHIAGPDETPSAAAARACFRQERNGQPIFPDVSSQEGMSDWKTKAQREMRLISEFPSQTEYWIRSSADGRFVAFGGWPSGIIDLQSHLIPGAAQRLISVDAYYDPGFFPDDSAFMFQGRGSAFCQMSLLKNPSTEAIDFSEDACTSDESVDIPLYQAIGANLDGDDYLAVTGAFMSDPGHGREFFRESSQRMFDSQPENALQVYPLQYDGQKWIRREPQIFDAGTEIDWGLSPSNRLLVSRKFTVIDDAAYPTSYQFYQLSRKTGEALSYEKESLGQICLKGLKGNFSFDDRFFVTYNHIEADQYKILGYSSAEDPEFLALLEAGSGNVFLHDLLTGESSALTHMGPGQYAQFPHFRSDDWLYFMVYDSKAKKRYLLGSDAALQAKQKVTTPLSL